MLGDEGAGNPHRQLDQDTEVACIITCTWVAQCKPINAAKPKLSIQGAGPQRQSSSRLKNQAKVLYWEKPCQVRAGGDQVYTGERGQTEKVHMSMKSKNW